MHKIRKNLHSNWTRDGGNYLTIGLQTENNIYTILLAGAAFTIGFSKQLEDIGKNTL
jgi:hypothetical protein